MSAYSCLLAQARMEALSALLVALESTADPAEVRRLATAIFKAPEPDDEIDRRYEPPRRRNVSQEPSATSPERSEGQRAPEAPPPPIRPCTPVLLQPDESRTHPLDPSLRSGLVANIPIVPARNAQPLVNHRTRASDLLAHAGRAP